MNSEKGSALFDNISNHLHVERRDWSDAHRSNKSFSSPWKQPQKFNEFWEYYIKNGFEMSASKYCDLSVAEVERKQRLKDASKRAHAYFLPVPIRRLIKVAKKIVKTRMRR